MYWHISRHTCNHMWLFAMAYNDTNTDNYIHYLIYTHTLTYIWHLPKFTYRCMIMHEYTDTHISSCIHCMHTSCMHAYIHTCTHTHTYIHTYIHPGRQADRQTDIIQTCIQYHTITYIQLHTIADNCIQLHTNAYNHIFTYNHIQLHKVGHSYTQFHTNTDNYRQWHASAYSYLKLQANTYNYRQLDTITCN